jgi:hypothetical protein
MNRLLKFCLVIVAFYLAFHAFIGIFLYDQFPIALQVTQFNLDQITEYRARVLIPSFFLTLIYFIYRYFAGKNPTSALWPVYVALVALVLVQIIGFLTFLPMSFDPIIMLLVTIFMLGIVRKAHNKRKKEFF